MTERVARVLHPGAASGVALVLDEPLSFWGGYDPHDGRIIDQRHPQRGQSAARRILVMRSGRGSSSSSTVLAEAIRAGTAPAGILLAEPDEIVVLGALVAETLDGRSIPVVELDDDTYATLATGDDVSVGADGRIDIRKSGA